MLAWCLCDCLFLFNLLSPLRPVWSHLAEEREDRWKYVRRKIRMKGKTNSERHRDRISKVTQWETNILSVYEKEGRARRRRRKKRRRRRRSRRRSRSRRKSGRMNRCLIASDSLSRNRIIDKVDHGFDANCKRRRVPTPSLYRYLPLSLTVSICLCLSPSISLSVFASVVLCVLSVCHSSSSLDLCLCLCHSLRFCFYLSTTKRMSTAGPQFL